MTGFALDGDGLCGARGFHRRERGIRPPMRAKLTTTILKSLSRVLHHVKKEQKSAIFPLLEIAESLVINDSGGGAMLSMQSVYNCLGIPLYS